MKERFKKQCFSEQFPYKLSSARWKPLSSISEKGKLFAQQKVQFDFYLFMPLKFRLMSIKESCPTKLQCWMKCWPVWLCCTTNCTVMWGFFHFYSDGVLWCLVPDNEGKNMINNDMQKHLHIKLQQGVILAFSSSTTRKSITLEKQSSINLFL